jgi:hypothetical protein
VEIPTKMLREERQNCVLSWQCEHRGVFEVSTAEQLREKSPHRQQQPSLVVTKSEGHRDFTPELFFLHRGEIYFQRIPQKDL